jgi:hypothetical protein
MLCPGSPRGTVKASPSSACGARARCYQDRPYSLSTACLTVNQPSPVLDVYPGIPNATCHRGQHVDDGWKMSALGRPCTRRFDRDDGILRELSLGFGVCRTHGMHTVEWHQAIAATILGCKATTSLAQLGAQKCVPCWEVTYWLCVEEGEFGDDSWSTAACSRWNRSCRHAFPFARHLCWLCVETGRLHRLEFGF